MATTYTRQHDFTTDRDATPPIPIRADRVDAELDAVKTSIDTIVAAGGVTTAMLADLAVTTAKIADSAITTAKIADNAVTSAKITDSNITTAKIADANVTTAKIADSSVTTAKISDANVTTAKITDANITTAKLATDSVTTVKITDANITTAKITDANVTTAKLADASVTTAKLADANVTTAKITDANVTTAKVADANITADKLASNAVTTVKVTDANITTAKIADANITTAKIADSAVTNAKLPSNLAMDATKIADGSISNTEFQYLNGATSNLQGQFDAMVDPSFQVDETDTNTAKNKSVSNSLAKGWQETKTAFDAQDISVHTDPLTMDHEATPSAPASGKNKLYFKSDNKLYKIDSSGSETMVGSDTDSVVTNSADIFTTNVRLLEQHGTASYVMEKGFTDELLASNDMIDESASSGYTYDATDDYYKNADGATGANDDKNYDTEASFLQQAFTNTTGSTSQATATNGSATVTISSGSWNANCASARITFNAGTNWYDITSRDSATQITLATNFGQSTSSTLDYEIRFTEFASVLAEDVNIGWVSAYDYLGSESADMYVSATWTSTVTAELEKVRVSLQKEGTPDGNITVYVEDASGTKISDDQTITAASVTTSWQDFDVTFSTKPDLVASTVFRLVLKYLGTASGSNKFWTKQSTTAYSGGQNYKSSDGTTWVDRGRELTMVTFYNKDVVRLNDRGGNNPITEYASVADTYAQSTDVSSWSDINSSAVTETLDSQNAFYWYSFDPASSYGAGTEIVVPKPSIVGINANTLFCSHFDGSDDAQTITDSSSSNYSSSNWTWTGTASKTKLETTSPKFGTASLQFGSNDSTNPHVISAANFAPANIIFGDTDWTVDFWMKGSSSFGMPLTFGVDGEYNGSTNGGTSEDQSQHVSLYMPGTTTAFRYGGNGSSITISSSNLSVGSYTDGNFHHFAFMCDKSDSGKIYTWVDGTYKGASTGAPTDWGASTIARLRINGSGTDGDHASGDTFIDELRISNNLQYTKEVDFTVRSAAYAADVTAYIRPIAKNDAGTWKYNSNASANNTWTAATSTTNDMMFAVSQAISSQAENRLTGSEISSLVDADFNLTNGFTTSDSKLTRGITLQSSSASQNPDVSQFRINYDSDASAISLVSKQWDGSTGRPSAPSTAPETMYLFVVDEQTSGTPSYFVSRDGTNFTAVTFDASWVFSGSKMARRASIDMSATNTGTNPKFKVTCPQGAVYKIHAVGLQTRG